MNVDSILAEFNSYAKEIIKKHTEVIKRTYSKNENEQLSYEIRLKVFNEHLDSLKEELQQKLNTLLSSRKTDTQAKYSLMNVYEKHINEFFRSEF
jgi:Ni,Fe-hydrogenase III component G